MKSDSLGMIDLAAVVAGTYATAQALDVYRQRAERAALRQWEQSVVAMHLGVESRVRRILAVGCGAGREVFALEALGFEVTGVDISAALIDIARAEAERRSSAASFLQIDGVTLPFPDAGVDAVVMWAQVLGHVPGAAARAALLAEARRVLRTGGIVSLSVHDRARTRPLLDDRRILRADTPEPGDLVIREPDFGSIGYWRYFDEPELRTLVTGAGFANISVVHTDDLGESWGNVFVASATAG